MNDGPSPSLQIFSSSEKPLFPIRRQSASPQLLKIHLGDRGFLMEDNPAAPPGSIEPQGYLCGRGMPVSSGAFRIADRGQGRRSGGDGPSLQRAYTFDLAVAEVDPKKCAVCYTCPRLCPHSAITVEKYAERNIYAPPGARHGETQWGAARVNPAACYGCGICVAECPAKAITFHHLNDEQIYAQMGLPE